MPLIYLVKYWKHSEDPAKPDKLGDLIEPVNMPYLITHDPQRAVDTAVRLFFRMRKEDTFAHTVTVFRGELDVLHERAFAEESEKYIVFIIRKDGKGFAARNRDSDFDKLVSVTIPPEEIDAIQQKPA